MIDILAEERGHDSTGDPLGRDIDARDIAGDAGMACMGAEIDQMDLAEGWIAARRLLGQFETGTQIGKPLQIAAAEIRCGLIAIVPGGDVGGVAGEFRNQRRVDIEASAHDHAS